MDVEDALTSANIRSVDGNVSVETTWTHESRVENVFVDLSVLDKSFGPKDSWIRIMVLLKLS